MNRKCVVVADWKPNPRLSECLCPGSPHALQGNRNFTLGTPSENRSVPRMIGFYRVGSLTDTLNLRNPNGRTHVLRRAYFVVEVFRRRNQLNAPRSGMPTPSMASVAGSGACGVPFDAFGTVVLETSSAGPPLPL